ncbi:MAG: cytochrome c [Bacteroidetes bacterium]|nr:cytochrome c [Bacteroidota bacterium]
MNLKLIVLTVVVITLFSCGGSTPTEEKTTEVKVEENAAPADPMSDKGIGPIKSIDITADVNTAMATEGEAIFTAKCTACHKIGKRYIGPDLAGVTTRRTPEWIMNMILNPVEMVEKNEIAKKLLAEYNAPMANQNLTEEEARKVLEFFRTKN